MKLTVNSEKLTVKSEKLKVKSERERKLRIGCVITSIVCIGIVMGCAHGPDPVPSLPASAPGIRLVAANDEGNVPAATDGTVVDSGQSTGESGDDGEKEGAEEKPGIADPLEPFNRAMYQFNDKLYFWVLKPVAQGYNKVVPEQARVSVRNFFSNVSFPVRFVNCLLQADIGGAASELGRFLVNTLWGIGGLLDPASEKKIDLAKADKDFGQTLGVYGLGQGVFITWPVLGPSSARDTVGLVGDTFLYPVNYLSPWSAAFGARAYEKVNDTSLSLGDYESLKEAAIDPYVAIRDAYVQYRQKKVKSEK